MIKEGEASSEEMLKLLVDGVAAINLGTALDASSARRDITRDFFAECSKLKLGELAMSDSFQLSEAMSAIELMDPKMDIGMVPFDPSTHLESLVAAGRLNTAEMEPRELIATMDAMFASLMSWLEGNSLAQTLLTCVCLHDADTIKDTALSSFCYGMLDLVTTFRHIIQTGAVYEEEDFNGCCFDLKTASPSSVLVALKAADVELQRKIRHKGQQVELLSAILSRISFVRLLIVALSSLVPPPAQDASSNTQFRPNVEDAAIHMRAACILLGKIEASAASGLQPEDSRDGDFAWLPAFEPDVNRRHLPPTFPRKTEMQSRVEGLRNLRKLCARILSIATELPTRVGTIEATLCFLRSFSLSESCVLSRSLLQLVYLPNDDHIMGRTPLSSVIVESLRLFAAPPILDPSCPLSSDTQCRASWDEFIGDSVKVFLGVIQVFGQNLARQREKIICCIEDLSALQNEAERAEMDFDNFLGGQEPSIGLSLTSFVLYHTLLLIEYHFYLSFRLDLFARFEYPYVYWYMSEIVFKWLLNTIDRSHNLIIADYRRSAKDKRKRKKDFKTKKEVELRKRISDGQRSLLFYKAQALLTEALFKASVGLIAAGKIRLPPVDSVSERLRFEHRMQPFASLAPPLILSYAQFMEISRVEALRAQGSAACFSQAAAAFESARTQLEQLDGVDGIDAENTAIVRICKHNAVVSRILSTGSKIDSQIDVVFGEASLVYPLLKIV